MTRAIVIPSDKDQPLRWEDHPSEDYKNMTALVFGGNRDGGTFTMSTVGDVPERRVSLFYDDEGLFRLDSEDLPDIINLRAMELWAFCDGGLRIEDFQVPLVGDYVVVGDHVDGFGDSADAPAWVMDFPYTWHTHIQIVTAEMDVDE